MYSTTPDTGRVHQHAKTVLSASISATVMPSKATSDDIYRLLIQNRELLLALSETLTLRTSAIESEPNDIPLRTSEAIMESGLSRTAFYDLRNPKHENFDESFPRAFAIANSQRFSRREIRAWVKAQATKSHKSNEGDAP